MLISTKPIENNNNSGMQIENNNLFATAHTSPEYIFVLEVLLQFMLQEFKISTKSTLNWSIMDA